MLDTSSGVTSLAALDTAAFDRTVLGAERPVAVLLSAPWCGPCRTFQPLLERVAPALGMALAKVDVEATPELAARYGVRSVPTLLVMRGGNVVARQVGSVAEAALRQFLGAAT
ncbi:MAG TPA: thioredoxin domain-containing protein [Nannocystaceae bacterium]|nr:thioredoxin domain-containing protein [Nannocystaceae bacterium]